MLKGVNRNVLVVRADKNSNFEVAYFVLKRPALGKRGDILKEAGRLVAQSGHRYRRGIPMKARFVLFGLGALFGALLSLLCGAIIYML